MLGKLRTVKIIKVELHLIMRIFLGIGNDSNSEEDERMSKHNCGLRGN